MDTVAEGGLKKAGLSGRGYLAQTFADTYIYYACACELCGCMEANIGSETGCGVAVVEMSMTVAGVLLTGAAYEFE